MGGSVGCGSTGGSVGGGSVGGGSVGGAFVGGIDVEAGAAVGPLGFGSLGSESRVRGVGDRNRVGVVVGVRVKVGVGVGRVEVIVGISEAVAVGTVAVGNGPSSAPAVIAIAVFVLLALFWLSALPRMGFARTITYPATISPRHKKICIRICMGIRFFPERFEFTRSVLLSYHLVTDATHRPEGLREKPILIHRNLRDVPRKAI